MTARVRSATSPTCLTPANHGKPCTAGAFQDQLQITFVSHLTEDGVDRRFIQCQVGHEVDSSTAVYTHVSSDFMNNALRWALAPALADCAGTEESR